MLHAIQAPATMVGDLLRATWDAGDAALVLPSGPAAAVDALLERMRPDLLTVADRTGKVVSQPVTDGAGVDDDVALVVATSGSTGAPKGVELTHAALHASTSASLARLGCNRGERWALVLPTHHIAGLQVLFRSWELGTEAQVADDLASVDAEHVSVVPTQLHRALEAGVDMARFSTVLIGGSGAPDGLLDRARDAGAQLVTSYGMSETCGGCVYDGVPLNGVDVEVADGAVRIRGPVLLKRYRGPRADAPLDPPLDSNGWFTTADRGRLIDGHLEVLGRADDVIVTGGENVPATAVTNVLRAHPAVADAAVYPIADVDWGHVVAAAIVPTDPTDAPTLTNLREHVRKELPASHVPKRLRVIDRIPRTDLGKLDRQHLT